MSFSKRAKTVKRLFRYIYNNLIGAFEVWDKATGTYEGLRDSANRIKEETEETKEMLSRDYEDAERYVKEGVSEAKDIWDNIRKVF